MIHGVTIFKVHYHNDLFTDRTITFETPSLRFTKETKHEIWLVRLKTGEKHVSPLTTSTVLSTHQLWLIFTDPISLKKP